MKVCIFSAPTSDKPIMCFLTMIIGNVAVRIDLSRDGHVEQAQIKV